jgi:hypothetical protein
MLVKVKVMLCITCLDRTLGFQEVEAPKFLDSWQMKVVRLSVICTGCLYPPGNISGTHFCQRLSRPQGHKVTERIMSMKNSSATIRNQTHDLAVYSAVPQPTVPLHALLCYVDWQVSTNMSKECSAFIFRVKQSMRMLVAFYWSTQCNIPRDLNVHFYIFSHCMCFPVMSFYILSFAIL